MIFKIKNSSVISKVYFHIKRFTIIIKQIMFSPFNLLKIDDRKVYIVSYYGQGYGDSGKAIIEKLKEVTFDYKVYWAVNKIEGNDLPEDVTPVLYGSAKHYKHMSTSKFWIDNSRKYLYPFKRKKQIYIQTWHGGLSLKKIEFDAQDKLSEFYLRNASKDNKIIDLFTSNSIFQDNLIKKAFKYEGKVMSEGTPRLDQIMNVSEKRLIELKNKINVSSYQQIILYAPTFRNNYSKDNFLSNYNELLSLNKNSVILLRLHPNDRDKVGDIGNQRVIDVTNYPDMYELMMISDILITDYSSSMFEFSFTGKPVFLLMKDFESYNDERGTYFQVEELPFSVSYDDLELVKNIDNFDNVDYNKKLNEFYLSLGINETGKASEAVCNYMIKMNGDDLH